MAIVGRKPKPQGQAVNRAKPVHEWTEVPNVPYEGPKPTLPRRQGGWPTWTRKVWATWSSMPHCILWTDADWTNAIDALFVAARFHEGDTRAATELRNREKTLGTTLEYRRDLRIRYVDPKPQGVDAQVTNLDDFRNL